MPDRIFVYYRVSTEKQNEAGTRETQELAVRRFLKDKDVEIVQEFYDVMTGSTRYRPQYQEMLSLLDEVQGIAVYDIDRLSGDYEEAVGLTFRLQKAGVKLYLAREQRIEMWDGSTNILVMNIKTWGAAEERTKIKARQRDAIQRYKAVHDGHWGRALKKIDWQKYDHHVKLGVSKSSIAKILGVSRKTLNTKIKERGT
jgi:DNA invertase Pin-like site-specific DNA recombinase